MLAEFALAASVLRPPGFDLKTWRYEDGLPSDAVIGIAQTGDGYLWIGTNAGLARFDGVRFTVFDHRTTPELVSDQCGPFHVDKEGALWFGTMGGGLTRYAKGRFTSFGRDEGASFEYITLIMPDRRGRLWLGTNDRLHLWDGSRFTVFGPENGLAVVRPAPVFEDAEGDLWVQGFAAKIARGHDGVFRDADGRGALYPATVAGPVRAVIGANGERWLIRAKPIGAGRVENGAVTWIDIAPGSQHDPITRLLPASNGDVWFGLRETGLRCLRGGRVLRIGAAEGLPAGQVTSLFEDREGNIWVGTSNGITRVRPRIFSSLDRAEGLEVERTWVVFEDHRGDVWIGTDLLLWRLHEGRLLHYSPAEGLAAFGTVSFTEDPDGTLWIGTTGGLASFDGEHFTMRRVKDGLPNDNVRALYTDRKGRVWIGTSDGLAVLEGGRFRTFRIADGLAGNWVRFIAEDSSGDLWFATTTGLSRLRDGVFTTFSKKDGLADDQVLGIHEDRRGSLWFGTYRGGLTRYRDGRFVTVSRAQGLHEDSILRILEDAGENFWISSPHGVFRVGRKELDEVADGRARSVSCVAFDKTDGLPTADCGGGTQPAGWTAHDGRMWFPTSRGVAVVDPAALRVNTLPPPVILEEVLIDRVRPGEPDRATLPVGSKTVEFHYTAATLSRPERTRFRYRLTPFDPDWVEAGERRVAYYTALRPGRYRFQVIAENESGVWNTHGATYDLRVEPHVYETPAFIASMAAALALLAWGAYKLRVRQIEARWAAVLAERGRIARELHDTVAQGFTGVSMQLEAASAKLEDAPSDVRASLERARGLVRTSLDDARRSVRALRPTLLESRDLAESLAALAAQLTAGTAIRAAVKTSGRRMRRLPPDTEDALFRVGQEAMTNAVRHGKCATIDVELTIDRESVAISVSDDGSGFDPSASKDGSGLAGMRKRIARLGGTIDIASAPGGGTRVAVTVPL